MQLAWHGHYLDGRTAKRQAAVIHLTPTGLEAATESGEKLFWPYEEIRQTQGFYPGEPVRLERGGEISEVLLISDQAFLTTAHRFAPDLTGHFHNPAKRRLRTISVLLAVPAAMAITVALYLWGIPAAAEYIAAYVPISWEEQLGEAVTSQIAPQEKQCTDPMRARVIDEILRTLTAAVPNLSYTFRVIVVNDPAVNALAAPGGYIVVFQGLIEKTKTAEELAGVLAHETQHILKRHATRMLVQQASTNLLLAALFGDVSGIAALGVESARTLGTLRYSRRVEEEADAEGMQMILAAGIDPGGMISFFETLKNQTGRVPEILSYLSTHPSTEDRIERLRGLAGNSAYKPARLIPDYDWEDVKKICSMLQERRQREK